MARRRAFHRAGREVHLGRFEVCRCFRGRPSSAARIPSMIPVNGSSFGRAGGRLRRYPGGTENASILAPLAQTCEPSVDAVDETLYDARTSTARACSGNGRGPIAKLFLAQMICARVSKPQAAKLSCTMPALVPACQAAEQLAANG